MRAREEGKLRLAVIRLARAAIKNAEIDKQYELSDGEVVEVLARELKMRRDAMEEYERVNRPEQVDILRQEAAILMEYLPTQLTEDEIEKMAQEMIAATGAQTVKDIGKVMGKLSALTKGRADGRLVNEIVRKFLPN
ncbi:MAG: GatB/YqeY domain-containing protein [Gracilibacteraceae bacterium]|jgi:uncharacterized protein YqeY|nr:GatB/YqeY domain-containing protein [Gracilibacteraceae bacterium]